MRKRNLHKRVCKTCGKEEFVRSDQLNCSCKSCAIKIIVKKCLEWRAENYDQFLANCGKGSKKHGLHNSRIYRIHKSMLGRCGHGKYRHKWSQYYEDKGIRVCDEWLKFEAFADWSFKNGYQEHLTIDRIDGRKGYSPDNCRWATRKEQQQNRSNSRSTRWSSVSNCCIECKTVDRIHAAKGFCGACYQRLLKNKKSLPI